MIAGHKMRYASIRTLRALAILTVVLGHLALVEVKFGQGATVLPAFLIRGLGGIDLFFIISGLMMVITSRGKFHSGKRALSFIYNRLVRIYPLYWIYSFAALAAFLIHPAWWVTNAPENWRDLLVSFLLLPSRRLPLLNVAWMLIHLIYFYFIFALFLWLLKEERLPAGLTLWACWCWPVKPIFVSAAAPAQLLTCCCIPTPWSLLPDVF